MRRRETVAALASLGALGGGSLIASGWLGDTVREEAVPETTLETIDARGSDAGEAIVPERGSVSFVDFFATWCTDCRQYMDTLVAFRDRAPAEIQFVSVSTEQVDSAVTREDIGRWFTGNRGDWTVALDPDLRLAEPVGATYVPHSFVFDEANRLVWSDSGLHDVVALEAALAKTEAGDGEEEGSR